MKDYSSFYDDPLHDEREEQRQVAYEDERATVRVNGKRYDADDLPSRQEIREMERDR